MPEAIRSTPAMPDLDSGPINDDVVVRNGTPGPFCEARTKFYRTPLVGNRYMS